MTTLTLDAYAKLNLGLRVRGRRPDGFHEIASVFQTIDLADRLILTERPDPGVRVTVSPDDAEVDPRDNLVTRAASRLRERLGTTAGVDIHLRKDVPIGAGLGGGSSDAAAALVGLNRLWRLNLPLDELHDVALELGSDVPFFLQGGRCRVQGRGERIAPVDVSDDDPIPNGTFVLLVPPWPLRTADVYRTFDQLDSSARLASPYANDLEAAALRLEPRLARYRDWLLAQGVDFGLSGSGPVYYAALATDRDARELVDAARAALSGEIRTCRATLSGQLFIDGPPF